MVDLGLRLGLRFDIRKETPGMFIVSQEDHLKKVYKDFSVITLLF